MRCPSCQTSVADNARFCGACGGTMATPGMSHGGAAVAPALAYTEDILGSDIAGRYRILSKLGQGGMGAVYRAEQISLKRIIALKLLRPELSQNPGIVQRFNKEAELAAKLNHPNTVTLFDFGQAENGMLFIAMELVDGTSLRNVLLREGALAPARALHIAEQVAASLADAHGHGIVHRDLKPDNVMLRSQGKKRDVVTVLDFGIAKLRDEGEDGAAVPVTQAGDLLGTPQYMAPEQIRADAIDGRTDVYALGVLLYELVTGRLPFQGPTVMAILSKHLTDAPVAPDTLVPDHAISPGLSGLIMQALEKSPASRPDSMESMAERIAALKKVAAGERPSSPMITRPPGVPLSLPGTTPNPLLTHTPPPLSTSLLTSTPDARAASVPAAMTPFSGTAPVAALTPNTQMPPSNEVTPMRQVGASDGTQAAPARKSRSLLYAVAGVAAAAAVVTAVMLGGSGGDGDGDGAAAGTASTQAAGTGSAEPAGRPIFSKHSDVGGLEWRNPRYPYALVLPHGFTAELVGNPENVSFVDGHKPPQSRITAMATFGGRATTTDAELMQGVKQLAASYKGVASQQQFVTIQGRRRLTGVLDAAAVGTRSRFVLYIEDDLILLVIHETAIATYATAEASRAELFEKRVKLLTFKGAPSN